VRDAPAVLDEAGQHAELDLRGGQLVALCGPVIRLDSVVRGVDPASGVCEVPGELDGRGPSGSEVPVDQDEAVVVEAEVVAAQVAVDQRRRTVRAQERVGQCLRAACEVQHGVGDVTRNQLAKGVPALPELLRQQVGIGALGVRHQRRGHADPHGQRGGAGRNAVPECPAQRSGGVEDAAALPTREPGAGGEQPVADVAHRDPRRVGGALCRDDAVTDGLRHPLECAGLVQQRGAPAIVRRARQPVGALAADALEDVGGAVGAFGAQQGGARVAAMGERLDALGPELLEEDGGRHGRLGEIRRPRSGGGAPELGDLARRPGSHVPAPPVGAARAVPLEAERDAGAPFLGVPVANRSCAGPPEVSHDGLRPVDPPAPGLAAGVQDRVGREVLAHCRPVSALDRRAQ